MIKLSHTKETKQMKIAVTYENGNVFQHFGHTEQFKVYEIFVRKNRTYSNCKYQWNWPWCFG